MQVSHMQLLIPMSNIPAPQGYKSEMREASFQKDEEVESCQDMHNVSSFHEEATCEIEIYKVL